MRQSNQSSQITLTNINNSAWTKFVILALIIFSAGIFLYGTALWNLIHAVLDRQDSSHGIIVPLLSGYFIWKKRNSLRAIKSYFDPFGIPIVAFSLLFPLLSFSEFYVRILSFLIFISGAVILIKGRVLFKEIAFPLFFLITLIPLPHGLYINFADYTRDITLGVSSWIIFVLKIPFLKEGTFIHLPNAVLNVNINCSGIRYLISFFVFGLAYSYLFRKTIGSRLILIALTIPISLTASVIRLTAIFLLTYLFGPHMAEYWPHVIISWIVFSVIMVASILLDQFYLNRKRAFS
jgi:exosortase